MPPTTATSSHAYRRCGRSGLQLPAVSLGLWHNFGDDKPLETQRAILRRAFDLGVTHFDLANNYGPPYGSAETNFGRIFAEDFRPYRDELVISTKAGYDMWPGPYGEWGSRKYLLASLDQSLARMGLDYVDIFYSPPLRPGDPARGDHGRAGTPRCSSGRALYAGISSYSPERTREAAAILRELGTPLLIHQPSYSMLNRWVEDGLRCSTCWASSGSAASRSRRWPRACSPTATSTASPRTRGPRRASPSTRPAHRRGARHTSGALNELAQGRGQSLAQLALAWVLRDERVTSVLIGASQCRAARGQPRRGRQPGASSDEVEAIDRDAVDSGINLWSRSSED